MASNHRQEVLAKPRRTIQVAADRVAAELELVTTATLVAVAGGSASR